MAEMGKAMMGTGEADGDNRAIRAAEAAISNPLLEDTSMSGARGLLINITGGDDLTLFEVDQAANRIREEVDEEANIIFGSAIDEALSGRIRVSVVATGIDSPAHIEHERPRLVAVGGGAPMPQPIPLPAHAVAAMSVPASGIGLHPLRQPAPHVVTLTEAIPGAPMMEAMIAVAQAPISAVPAALPVAQHAAPRSSLFAEPRTVSAGTPAPMSQESARPSLFSTVTGAFRRRQQAFAGAAEPPPVRTEAPPQEPRVEPPRAQVRQTAGEEVGLDIPAFLRRQSS
jgi:cell division protein FtsZ